MSVIRTPPFYLIDREGNEHLFETLALLHDYCRAKGIYLRRPYNYYNQIIPVERLMVAEQHTTLVDGVAKAFGYIVRDSYNRIILPSEIAASNPHPQYEFRSWWNKRAKEICRAEELGLPIPGTGKGRGWCSNRRPHHIADYRARAAIEADLKTDEDYADCLNYFKPAWGDAPPNNWDEIPRSSFQKSWKKHRRTKWRKISKLKGSTKLEPF